MPVTAAPQPCLSTPKPPGCHRGPAALHCLPERGGNTDVALCRSYQHIPATQMWLVIFRALADLLKMSRRLRLPIILATMSRGRVGGGEELLVNSYSGEKGVLLGLVGRWCFYEKQSLRWRWRGNLILLAVRETQLTSQQKSVRFLQSSVSGKIRPICGHRASMSKLAASEHFIRSHRPSSANQISVLTLLLTNGIHSRVSTAPISICLCFSSGFISNQTNLSINQKSTDSILLERSIF